MKFDPATLNILGNVSEPGLTEWLFFLSIWMPVFGGNVFTYVIYTYNIEKLFCKTSLFMLHSAGIELRTFKGTVLRENTFKFRDKIMLKNGIARMSGTCLGIRLSVHGFS